MSVALQVFLLVVAILVAVAGIGVALALRMPARQRKRMVAARREHVRSGAAHAGRSRRATDNVVPLPATATARAPSTASTMAVPAAPAVPQTPEEAHQAKLQALQALLALGDAKAAVGQAGAQFADTEPADEGYAATQFNDRPGSGSSPLLDLDKASPRRRGAQR